MLVTAVGPHSINGKTLLGLQTEMEDTPLQKKLEDLAENIGKAGLAAAVLMFIVLIVRYFVEKGKIPTTTRSLRTFHEIMKKGGVSLFFFLSLFPPFFSVDYASCEGRGIPTWRTNCEGHCRVHHFCGDSCCCCCPRGTSDGSYPGFGLCNHPNVEG